MGGKRTKKEKRVKPKLVDTLEVVVVRPFVWKGVIREPGQRIPLSELLPPQVQLDPDPVQDPVLASEDTGLAIEEDV